MEVHREPMLQEEIGIKYDLFVSKERCARGVVMTTRLRVATVVAPKDLLLALLSALGLRGACDELSACGVSERSIDEVN